MVVSQQRYLVKVAWKFQRRITNKTHLSELHLVTYMRTELIQNASREECLCFTFILIVV